MQILEVKNNIAKITYNPSENKLLPSDFLLIEDTNQKLIAQVINIETTDKSESNLATLRLALNIDKEDNLSYYNGYIPAKTSKLIYITSEEIIELIKGNDDNIYFGNLSNHPSCYVKTNMSFLDDRLYIQSDRTDKTQILFKNIISELKDKNKKIIILDFDGQFASAEKALRLKISNNMRLPLNMEAFDTILAHDIVDCPIEDKAVIQSIVLELREYLKTLKDKYIPFNMFKQVVDSEFASNPVSGLMLLRNKLWMYAQDGIFADKKEQFDVINSAFLNQKIIIVDASEVAEKWYKFIIQTIIELTSHDCYLFLSLNDVELDKKAISGFYNKKNIIPIVATGYDSAYRPILKSLCKNQLLAKPSIVLNEQEYYSPLLQRMNNIDVLLYGETTLFLPLQIELQQFDEDTAEDVVQNEIKRDVDKLLSSPQTVIPVNANVAPEIQEPESLFEEEIVEEIVEEEPVLPAEELIEDDITDTDFDFLDEIQTVETPKVNSEVEVETSEEDDILNVPFNLSQREDEVEAIMNSLTYDVFEPVKEIPKVGVQDEEIADEIPDQPVTIEATQDTSDDVANIVAETAEPDYPEENAIEDNSDIDKQEVINEAVDDIVSSVDEEELVPAEDVESSTQEDIVALDDIIENIENKAQTQEVEETPEMTEDVVDADNSNQQVSSKDDDFVVEFEDDDDETSEEQEPPEINENINTKETHKVPIYETDTSSRVLIDQIPFKVNDRVFHPKYGNGVIESFIHYSNNILFSLIDFDTAGRKMLDPRISGIEKIR